MRKTTEGGKVPAVKDMLPVSALNVKISTFNAIII